MQGKKGQNAVQRGGFNPDTVFSKILNGSLPAAFVYRDETVSAFMDIQPINPGHVLVIPNKSARTLAELPQSTAAHMFSVGQKIAAALRRTDLACEGVNLFMADGVAAGQTVFHMHLHVFPRYTEDGFRWQLPEKYYDPPSEDALEDVSKRIKQELAKQNLY